jgi:hypothetical protein
MDRGGGCQAGMLGCGADATASAIKALQQPSSSGQERRSRGRNVRSTRARHYRRHRSRLDVLPQHRTPRLRWVPGNRLPPNTDTFAFTVKLALGERGVITVAKEVSTNYPRYSALTILMRRSRPARTRPINLQTFLQSPSPNDVPKTGVDGSVADAPACNERRLWGNTGSTRSQVPMAAQRRFRPFAWRQVTDRGPIDRRHPLWGGKMQRKASLPH